MTTRPWYQCNEFYGRRFLGTEALKNPLDAWSVQELLWECRPKTLVETGTYYGGSARYYAALFDAIGDGEIITIDKEPRAVLEHPRIIQLVGDCQELFEEVKGLVRPPNRALGGRSPLEILDTEIGERHVEEVLERINQGIFS